MAGVATSLSIQDRMTKELNKIARASANLNKMLEITDRLSDSVDAGSGFSQVTTKANTAASAVDGVNKKQQQTEQGAKKIASAWGGIGGIIKGAIAAFGVTRIIGLADEVTQTTARLNLMNDGLQTTAQLQDKIFASANRARASYQDTAKAVAKLGTNAKDAFSGNNETIAFAEQVNKQFAISAVGPQEASNAWLQLTQAMGSGVLRGDELNSIFEQAPSIIQTIADYMDVPIGKIREMASEGMISSEIIKNAMLSAADETNAKFAEIPMTFSQVATIAKNVLLEAFMPVLQMIGQGAQWIYDNWSTVAPVFYGLAAAILAYAAALGIQTTATWLATGAAQAFFATLMANPLFWIALGIGAVVMWIYSWVQSVGGLEIAWKIAMNGILTALDKVDIGISAGAHSIQNSLGKMKLGFSSFSTGVQNYLGDMKANGLMTLQEFVNGAIDTVNKLISAVNSILPTGFELINHVTFGATAKIENEAAKQGRNDSLAAAGDQLEADMKQREQTLNKMKSDAAMWEGSRQRGIAKAQMELRANQAQSLAGANSSLAAGKPFDGNIDKVGEVGKIKEDVNIAEEDLKFLRDIAEMRYIQNFVTLTPTVAVDAKINETVDLDEVVDRIERKLEDEFVMAAEGVYN